MSLKPLYWYRFCRAHSTLGRVPQEHVECGRWNLEKVSRRGA
jgi:hypothetical protein